MNIEFNVDISHFNELLCRLKSEPDSFGVTDTEQEIIDILQPVLDAYVGLYSARNVAPPFCEKSGHLTIFRVPKAGNLNDSENVKIFAKRGTDVVILKIPVEWLSDKRFEEEKVNAAKYEEYYLAIKIASRTQKVQELNKELAELQQRYDEVSKEVKNMEQK